MTAHWPPHSHWIEAHLQLLNPRQISRSQCPTLALASPAPPLAASDSRRAPPPSTLALSPLSHRATGIREVARKLNTHAARSLRGETH